MAPPHPHPFVPGIDVDDPDNPSNEWCNTCGERVAPPAPTVRLDFNGPWEGDYLLASVDDVTLPAGQVVRLADAEGNTCAGRIEGTHQGARGVLYLVRPYRTTFVAAGSSPAGAPEVTHLCPYPEMAVTPCCGMAPIELPRADRMTVHHELVTCPAWADDPSAESEAHGG